MNALTQHFELGRFQDKPLLAEVITGNHVILRYSFVRGVFFGWGEECVAQAKHDFPHPKKTTLTKL